MLHSNERLAPSQKEQRITSLEIAELTGKGHRDLLRSIRNQEIAWEKINERKFTLVEYRDKKGESRPMYELTKMESLYIISKYNDETRAKLVKRWFDLEMSKVEATAPLLTLPTGLKEHNVNGNRLLPYRAFLVKIGAVTGRSYERIKRYPQHFLQLDNLWYITEELAQQIVLRRSVYQSHKRVTATQGVLVLGFGKTTKGGVQ